MYALVYSALSLGATSSAADEALAPLVELEETVFSHKPTGTTALWDYGSTNIVRYGDDVYVSGMITAPTAQKSLNDAQCTLWHRLGSGWKQILTAPGKELDPCPLAITGDGTIALSTNPTRFPSQYNGSADPTILWVMPTGSFGEERPKWTSDPGFNEHSYRGLAVDARARSMLVINAAQDDQYWAYRDPNGSWSRLGVLRYPLRASYPIAEIDGNALRVFSVSNVPEPIKTWHDFKTQKNSAQWDYVYRNLYYVETADVRNAPFSAPVLVDSVESTGGRLLNLDLWVDAAGATHLLYLKVKFQTTEFRDRFFQNQPLLVTLEHCIVEAGKVQQRTVVAQGTEGGIEGTPDWGHFHVSADGALYVVFHVGSRIASHLIDEERIARLNGPAAKIQSLRIPLQQPLWNFMVASPRTGSQPSAFIDLLGFCKTGIEVCYARVRLPSSTVPSRSTRALTH